ncbi:MAG: YceI family protein [Lysobacteraceae bacterium]
MRWRSRLAAVRMIVLLTVMPVVHAMPLQIDGAQSVARFALRGPWLVPIEGRFAHIEGRVQPDAEEARYDVNIRIAAGSVLMRRDSYESWARSPEFFDVERHPWIEFSAVGVPRSLLLQGGELQGELQLRGRKQPIVLTMQAARCDTPGQACPVIASGEIDRSDFGMQARRLLIGEHVRLEFEFLLKPEAKVDGTP